MHIIIGECLSNYAFGELEQLSRILIYAEQTPRIFLVLVLNSGNFYARRDSSLFLNYDMFYYIVNYLLVRSIIIRIKPINFNKKYSST